VNTRSYSNLCRCLSWFSPYRDRVQKLLQAAYERIGITAVQTIIIGRHRPDGLYPAEAIRQVIEEELAHGGA